MLANNLQLDKIIVKNYRFADILNSDFHDVFCIFKYLRNKVLS